MVEVEDLIKRVKKFESDNEALVKSNNDLVKSNKKLTETTHRKSSMTNSESLTIEQAKWKRKLTRKIKL